MVSKSCLLLQKLLSEYKRIESDIVAGATNFNICSSLNLYLIQD